MSTATAALSVKCPRLYITNDFANAPVNGLADGAILKVYEDGDPSKQLLEMYFYDWETAQWLSCDLPDVFRSTQALTAGSNTITHNLGRPEVEVEVRNAATGALISARVIAEAPSSVELFVPVAVASANITVDA